jgi:hypothetical protein
MPPRKRTPAKKSAPPAARPVVSLGVPELIVMADPAAALRMSAGGVTSHGGADTRALNRVAARGNVTLRPLFGPEDRVRLQAERLLPNALAPVPDLSVYYHVDAPPEELDGLADELRAA